MGIDFSFGVLLSIVDRNIDDDRIFVNIDTYLHNLKNANRCKVGITLVLYKDIETANKCCLDHTARFSDLLPDY